MVYGILRDKERLDAGEPTEITAVYSHTQIQGLDKLSQLLSQTLLPSGDLIDVTPAGSGMTKAKDPRSNMMRTRFAGRSVPPEIRLRNVIQFVPTNPVPPFL